VLPKFQLSLAWVAPNWQLSIESNWTLPSWISRSNCLHSGIEAEPWFLWPDDSLISILALLTYAEWICKRSGAKNKQSHPILKTGTLAIFTELNNYRVHRPRSGARALINMGVLNQGRSSREILAVRHLGQKFLKPSLSYQPIPIPISIPIPIRIPFPSWGLIY